MCWDGRDVVGDLLAGIGLWRCYGALLRCTTLGAGFERRLVGVQKLGRQTTSATRPSSSAQVETLRCRDEDGARQARTIKGYHSIDDRSSASARHTQDIASGAIDTLV